MTLPTQDLYTELYDGHWKHVHNWTDVNPDKVAKRHECAVETVHIVMSDIEKEYPKSVEVKP